MVVMPHHNSRQVELQNIYHVPRMNKNLLSVSQLTDSGNYDLFRSNDVKVYQNLKVTSIPIIEGKRLESIYIMPTKTTYVVLDDAPIWLYNEVSLSDSRKLEQELQYKLEREVQRSVAEQEQKVREKYNSYTEEEFSK